MKNYESENIGIELGLVDFLGQVLGTIRDIHKTHLVLSLTYCSYFTHSRNTEIRYLLLVDQRYLSFRLVLNRIPNNDEQMSVFVTTVTR